MNWLQGQLLVSSPTLLDPNFRRTVVLVTHHDENGALGVVLTRPSDVSVESAVPELADLSTDPVVYGGGPVDPNAHLVLAEFVEETDDEDGIAGRLGFMAAEIVPDELEIRRLRVFAGYSGWGPGQLEEEIAESAWIVTPAEPDDAFVADPDELWRTVLERKGGKFALLATMPFDPNLN